MKILYPCAHSIAMLDIFKSILVLLILFCVAMCRQLGSSYLKYGTEILFHLQFLG